MTDIHRSDGRLVLVAHDRRYLQLDAELAL
jgi:hypothetical protein